MEHSFLVAFHCIAAIIVCFIVVNNNIYMDGAGFLLRKNHNCTNFFLPFPPPFPFLSLLFPSPFLSPHPLSSLPFSSFPPTFFSPFLFALPFFSSRPKIQPGGLGERC